MRHLTLTEYATTSGVELDRSERDALAALIPTLQIRPMTGEVDRYDLTPGSYVGALRTKTLSVEIRPKLPAGRVLFLMSYALNAVRWKELAFDFESAGSVVEAVVPAFTRLVRAALRRGLLQGYRYEEDSLPTVRGRIRFGEQVRRRHGLVPPIEVAYDDFTEDVLENQLLKAAVDQLGRLRLRSLQSQRELRELSAAMAPVRRVHFDARRLPEVRFTQMNAHYRPAITLALLVLRCRSTELAPGQIRASTFLVDMNEVFEAFVATALREALGLSKREFPRNAYGRPLYLDAARRVKLEPDLSWWQDRKCVFIGDAKYKRVNLPGVNHSDLYQMLAYVTATGLSSGLLIYAEGEETPRSHFITAGGKRLDVLTLRLDGEIELLLKRVMKIAAHIRMLLRSSSLGS